MYEKSSLSPLFQLGYKPIETKLISTTEPGRDGVQVKGFFSTETGGSYVNDKYNNSNYELLKTSATEGQRAMDAQKGSTFNQNDEYRADRSAYSQNFGSNVANYTDFALYYTNQGSLSTSANSVSVPNQVTSMPSVFNNQVANNNIEFAGLDKSKGDNYTYQEAMALASKYPSMAIYKDPSIQGGYGVAPKDVAAEMGAKGKPLPKEHFLIKFPNDVSKGFAGLEASMEKLYNLDTSKMTPLQKATFDYLNLKVVTVPAVSESDVNLVDRSSTILKDEIGKNFKNQAKE
ncbi:MAG TPA: hypothetical protein PKW30_08030 [Campylobacterales bacterium]|nr:hypothetical protein [Campylobacterales bacterium]